MRNVARGLSLIWAGWWVFFGLASGLAEHLSPAGIARHTAVPGLLFLASALLAWRREAPGGGLLVLEGLAVFLGYRSWMGTRVPWSTVVFVWLTMALPPVVAGGLFLAGALRRSTKPL